MTTYVDTIAQYAYQLSSYGLSVLPTHTKDKLPVKYLLDELNERGSWQPLQTTRIKPDEAHRLFCKSRTEDIGIGVVCGAVSGNLELIDCDIHNDQTGTLWTEFCDLLENAEPGLLRRLVIQQTQSGGYHLIYRCTGEKVGKNTKLASNEHKKTLIETRGEGGYFLIAPTKGYKLINGSLDAIPDITPAERENLLASARAMNRYSNEGATKHSFHEQLVRTDFDDGDSPLDDYDRRGDVIQLLSNHGWTLKFSRSGPNGAAYYLQRPGKSGRGISATYNYVPGRFYVFTTSTQFSNETIYKPSALYAFLECGGDFRLAAKRLLAEGYGKPRTYKKKEYPAKLVERAPLVVVDESKAPVEDVNAFVRGCLFRNEIGDADLFVLLARGKYCYDATKETWYVFNPNPSTAHWQEDRARSAYTYCSKALTQTYEAYAEHERQHEAELKRQYDEFMTSEDRESATRTGTALKKVSRTIKAIEKRCDQLRQLSRIRNILTFASSGTDNLAIFGDEWDSDPWLLGVKNGVVDLRANAPVKFRPARPEDYIRKAAPTEWKGTSEACPRFIRFLGEIFGEPHDTESPLDRPITEFVMRLFGYGITGLNTEHIYPILCGEDGRNGKDTLLETIRAVLGADVANSVNNDVVISSRARSNGQAQPELYDLWGMRLAWVSETQESDRLNAAQLKLLSGGGTIKCRPLHGNMVSFEPTHLLMLITNFKPLAPSDDQALWERIALVPFERRFVENPDPENPLESKADPYLKSQLLAEAPGILRLLVYYCELWQTEGLQKPEQVRVATQEYRNEMDGWTSWLETCVDLTDVYAQTSSADLYQSYLDHCNKVGIKRPISVQAFGRKVGGLEKVRKVRDNKGDKAYDGICLHTKSKSSLFHSN